MKPLSDYSHIRGIHMGFEKGPDHMPLEKQLEYCRKLDLNSNRLFTDYAHYALDPEGVKKYLKETIELCWKYGVSTMQILFGGNQLDPVILEPEFWAEKGDPYVRDMVLLLKDEPGLLMWDVMNEPTCNLWYSDAPEDEKPARLAKITGFLKHYCALVKELDPDGCITIGHTEACDLEPSAAWVDVLCFHDYRETRARIAENYDLAEALGRKYGKPVINSETCCNCRANPYDLAIKTCVDRQMGFYVFCLLAEGFWGEVHGLIYPDGTIRNPEAIAALYGFFINRSPSRIKPNPNREGYVYKAIKGLEEALTDTRGLFKNVDRSSNEILEAAEYAANLLEANGMVATYDLPSAKILDWRAQQESERDMVAIRKFAYDLGKTLKEWAQVL
jgi:hypothetical protein